MEVVAAAAVGRSGAPPFHEHDVREWSRLDSLTGVLEKARLETDHWAANTADSCHKYGKVVDSRARTNADGGLQQRARRQLEVYQSQIPGGHLQVIKTHTVSSSRWSSRSPPVRDFEDLQLPLNPLDISSQKSKANVGRSAVRRPPSRVRSKDEAAAAAAPDVQRVARLCSQNHALRRAVQNSSTAPATPPPTHNGHAALVRTKSSSSEELHQLNVPEKDKSTKSTEDLEDLEQLQNWRRSSKLRRSLQNPKQNSAATAAATTTRPPPDLPTSSGSVRRIREELEKGRRLSTALRGNNVDLGALDQILQSISSSSSVLSSDNATADDRDDPIPKVKRSSFVTVATLQEIRGRLRRTSSAAAAASAGEREEDADDGIVDDNKLPELPEPPRMRSYVYGAVAAAAGTGSLESRAKLGGATAQLRNEDWHNRRKSYGFEQVHSTALAARSALQERGRIESSTDSGICRSTEIVVAAAAPTAAHKPNGDVAEGCVKRISSLFNNYQLNNNDIKSTTITIPISGNSAKRHSIAVDETKYVCGGSGASDKCCRRTSSASINPPPPALINDDDTVQNKQQQQRLKRVEFCKTEVHFAADSGKVNIVETDEKPPPTNNFRRRRRNSGPILDDCIYPVLHFGDTSYEKSLLGGNSDTDECTTNSVISCGNVTVNTTSSYTKTASIDGIVVDERKESLANVTENDNIKGILKNKPIKPTPYHLGENEHPFGIGSLDDEGKWGVRLKPTEKNETPIWKSTVTLQNTIYNHNEQSEFQKLLKNLKPVTFNQTDSLIDDLNSKFVISNGESRRCWSVADRVKLNDDTHSSIVEKNYYNNNNNNKVYSTKVNFGNGEATVVENNRKDKSAWINNEYKDLVKPLHFSPLLSKTAPLAKQPNFKNSTNEPKLSSPSLVIRNTNNDLIKNDSNEYKNINDIKLKQKFCSNDIVLRQPKKSEMTYFGVAASPKLNRKSETVISNDNISNSSNNSSRIDVSDTKHVNKLSPERPDLLQHHVAPAPGAQEGAGPIYENVESLKRKSAVTKTRYGREFDNTILEELTRAADQILQAVNGFAGEDSHDEIKQQPLDTIAESRSWSQNGRREGRTVPKAKLRHTPSTSSVEGGPRRPGPLRRAPFATGAQEARPAKKTGAVETSARAVAKARRLQRASSREALLQSHGSSSEDLAPTPLRKPRQVKKTKVNQLSMTNGTEQRQPAHHHRKDERITGAVPEIRHKTAISTIRSTIDNKAKEQRGRARAPPKRDAARGAMPLTRSDVKRSTSSTVNHRISTANIKKCHRSEAIGKH